jgi:hypothetical protein
MNVNPMENLASPPTPDPADAATFDVVNRAASSPSPMDEPVQQTAEELLRPMATEPGRAGLFDNSPALPPGLEFALAVMCAVFSPLLCDAPLGALTHSSGGYDTVFIFCTLLAAAGVRLGLLAIWLAWGQSRVVWRLPIVLPSVAFSILLWTGGRREEWLDIIPAMIFVVLGTALAAAIPRLFGIYRINLLDPPNSADGKVNEGQFRLIDMFAWTATAAVLAGMMRWIGLPNNYEWIAVVVFTPVGSLMALAALWAALSRRALLSARLLAPFGVVFFIGTIFCSFTGGDPEAIFYIYYTLTTAMALSLGALYVARRMGIRLVSRSLPLIAPPATAKPSATAIPAPPNETNPEVAASGLE